MRHNYLDKIGRNSVQCWVGGLIDVIVGAYGMDAMFYRIYMRQGTEYFLISKARSNNLFYFVYILHFNVHLLCY